jgi:hypothetical protein
VLALRDLQARFFRSLAAAPGPAASRRFDPALLGHLDGRGGQGPADRLDVYAQMYWARLVDVLREDFPRVAAILGADRFGAAARAYLARHPSIHPSVRHVGDRFAAFLAGWPEAERWPFLADLARLEWFRLAVFDAADVNPLRVDDLRALAPEAWPGLTFRPVPAVRLLRSRWPLHELWAADAESPREPVRPARTELRVWRSGFAVYQARMDARESRALASVAAGKPFAATCAVLVRLVGNAEEAAREAGRLVLRWVEDGILARPELDPLPTRQPRRAMNARRLGSIASLP